MSGISVSLQPDRLTVFTFHGVVDDGYTHPVRNQTGKHIHVGRFREIIRDLVGVGWPVSLSDLHRPLPNKPYAITFDDGFANVLRNAVPILRDYSVPATFFINASFCYDGANSHTWADQLEQHYAASDIPSPSGELWAHRNIVKNTPYIDPYKYAAWVLAGITPPADPQLDPKLTWADLKELAADPLFTVGGHGDDHRILPHLDSRNYELEHNIGVCCADLYWNLGKPTTLFSYPDGKHSPEVIETLRRQGITHAFTTEPGTWKPGDDPYLIPRVKAV